MKKEKKKYRYFVLNLLGNGRGLENCIRVENNNKYGVWLGKRETKSKKWNLRKLLKDKDLFREIQPAEFALL